MKSANPITRLFLLWLVLLIAQPVIAESYKPTEREIQVAVLGIMVAAASTMGARTLQPPVEFSQSRLVIDSTYSDVALVMQQADIGYLREVVLAGPVPPPVQLGLMDLLSRKLNPFSLDYYQYADFIRPQKLQPNEMIVSGTVRALRNLDSYPFRYEGSATLHISGMRFSQPMTLELSFTVPLEGPQALMIIPNVLLANEYDFIHVARTLFKTPK